MTLCIVQATLNAASGVPADAMTNTFHFEGNAPLTDFDNVRDLLKDFYGTAPTGGVALRTYMAASSVSGVMQVKIYKTTDPKPRSPVYTATVNIGAISASGALPQEVAICSSFKGDPASGTPAARRRNRIYLGGLNQNVLGTGGRILDAVRDNIALSTKQLYLSAAASVNWEWVGYSPTDGASWVIGGGWVDNAFDTQRRRGIKATGRSIWTD